MTRHDTDYRSTPLKLLAGLTLITSATSLVGIFGRSQPSEKNRQRGQDASPASDARIRSAIDAAQDALAKAKERLDSGDGEAARDELRRRLEGVRAIARSELQPRTRSLATGALEVASRLQAEGSERSAGLGEKLKADVAPTARAWAEEAIDEAEKIINAARIRASNISGPSQANNASTISMQANQAGKIAAGAAAGLANALARGLGDSRRRPAKRRGSQQIDRGKQRARRIAHDAGARTKYATGQSLLILFWGSALSLTVYFTLLSNDQRERVRHFVVGTVSQILDLFQDFQRPDSDTMMSTD